MKEIAEKGAQIQTQRKDKQIAETRAIKETSPSSQDNGSEIGRIFIRI